MNTSLKKTKKSKQANKNCLQTLISAAIRPLPAIHQLESGLLLTHIERLIALLFML